MRIEPVDRIALAFVAVGACYTALRTLRRAGREASSAIIKLEENDSAEWPAELVAEYREAGSRLEEAVWEAMEAIEPIESRLNFASKETVEDEELAAPSWAQLVVLIAGQALKPGWRERIAAETPRDVVAALSDSGAPLRMEQRGTDHWVQLRPKSRSFVESELAREEARLRSGVAPIRHAPSNGLWRVESGEVVFSEDVKRLGALSRRILEQLILACGKLVTPEEFGAGAWQDHAYEPNATAIKTAVSRLRSELREAAYDDIANRIPDGEKGCHRLRTS